MAATPDPPLVVPPGDSEAVERYLHEHIPISAAMGMRVARADLDAVELAAALAPNVNHRSTVFGGSSASVAILAAWTLVHLRVSSLPGDHRVVIRESRMTYLAPIRGEFQARCAAPAAEVWDRFARLLDRRGRAQVSLDVEVTSADGTCATFSGVYAAVRIGDEPAGA